MAILRTDIIRALDELIANEAGLAFQALAVVLTKQKWPDLIASEWHNDGGLVQLATVPPRDGELSFLVDLPAWIRSGTDVLDFIARGTSFRARNISATDLARLPKQTHFSFLLNGWNEIAEVYSDSAVTALTELERSFPAAGIVVATRSHHISPPLPGVIRTKLMRFTRRLRAD